MRKSLMLLDELQQIDLKLDGFKGEKDSLLTELGQLDGKVAEADAAIAAKNGELALLEDEKLALEENLAAETENIIRSDVPPEGDQDAEGIPGRLERDRYRQEIKVELEDQILQKIGRMEELRTELARNGGESCIAAGKHRRTEERGAGQDRPAGGRHRQDIEAREETAEGSFACVIRRYTLLREQRRGIAVVEARAGSCLGCNMNLPPQLYNTPVPRRRLITCPHCQRILVLRQEE